MRPSFTQSRLGLTTGQVLTLVFTGAILWFLAAILLRTIGPMGAFEGGNRALLYALTIPATVPFVWAVQRLAKLAGNQIVIGVAVATATAGLLDGIAVAWFSQLYGGDLPQVTNSAAAILWGAEVALALACVMNREPTT